MTMANFSNFIGIIGVGLILLAYFLLQCHKLSGGGMIYSVINLFGAILILISLMFHWNTPSVVIEIAWILISLVGVYKNIIRRRQLSKTHANR